MSPCGSTAGNSPEFVDEFASDEQELGISPLGMVSVALLALVGLALYLDPKSALYDVAVAGIIVLSVSLAFGSGLQRFKNEADLIRTVSLGLIGAAIVSVIVTVSSLSVFTQSTVSTVQSNVVLILTLPAVFEELFFRVALFLNFIRVMGRWPAVILQAVFFAVYHAWRNPDMTYFVVLFAGGIVFMLVFLVSKNILSSMIAHAVVNLRPILMDVLMNPLLIGVVAIVLIIFVIKKVL